jgi:AraC family transcriptional regulator
MNDQPLRPVTPAGSSVEPLTTIPIIARNYKAWRGLTIEWERLGPYAFKPHQFPEHRVSMALSRCPNLIFTKGGVSHDLPLETGDLSIVPAGMEIGYSWESQIEILSLQLEPTFLEEVAALTMDLNGHQVELVGQPKLRDPFISTIAQALRRELEYESTGSRLLVESLTQALAVHLLRAYASFPARTREVKGGLPRWRLRRALEYIEEHVHDEITLAQLAEVAGNLSRYHFARLFKQSTGHSPYQYFIQRRIKQAQTMLRSRKSAGLAEIAFECGFRDQSTFSRMFRQITGCTPSNYRDS